MKHFYGHILTALAIVLVLFSSCSKEEDKVIPRSKLARIYAEMLIMDQWIDDTPSVRSVADTSLIYEPILEKYGYTKMDYLHTVDRYLDDPERFARIWRETSDILDARLKDAKKRRDALQSAEDRLREREKYAVDFDVDGQFPYMFEEPFVHYHDSLAFQIDTAIRGYRFFDVVTADTTFDGPRMNIQIDTLAVTDSLAAVDSLAAADSLKAAIEKKAGALKVDAPDKTIRQLDKDRNLPLRQLRKPQYSKEMKTTEELKVVHQEK